MGEENTRTVRSLPKNILRTSRSCKVDNDSSLRHEEVESRSWGFSVYLIGYFKGYFMSSKRVRVLKSQNDRDTWSNGKDSIKQ